MHKQTHKYAGFTLVELMVAISLLGLMLFLINRLFNDTSAAVSTSVQTSQVIATTRILGEQIDDDTSAMFGPGQLGNNGYIVIVQERYNNIPILNPRTLAEVRVDGLRGDQLIFVRDAGGLRSMTPQDNGSYRSNLVGQDGGYAKVWYGLLQRTLNNGEKSGTQVQFQRGGDQSANDRIANDWLLGRQAMLFNPTDEIEAARPNPRPNQTVAGAPGNYVFADNSAYYSDVRNTAFGGDKFTHMGLTDVTVQSYGPVSDTNSLLYALADPTYGSSPDDTRIRQNNFYRSTAFPDRRYPLLANPSPDSGDTGYQSWAIAQSHPILASNCSEFIVDFAADLNGNGLIDTELGGGVDNTGSIYWYDSIRDGDLQWEPRSLSPATTSALAQPQPLAFTTRDQRIFIFRVNDDAPFTSASRPTSAWPYLIRVRYRLHDDRGRLMSNNPAALRDGLDNNGNGEIDEINEDKYAGRWFEHIIRVPRPDPS